jgi:hypothetical protein
MPVLQVLTVHRQIQTVTILRSLRLLAQMHRFKLTSVSTQESARVSITDFVIAIGRDRF